MTIKVDQINKNYGKQKALDNITFEIKPGELIGFLGPNGAGKSTLMKIITGYIEADSGAVFINNQLVNTENTNIKTQIGYLPENNPLYPELYIKEYLEMVAGFYKLQNKKELVAEMIELTGLAKEQHKKIKALSKGYRQRVGLAQALIHDPAVLILDEPTTGLDPNQLEEIRQLIKNVSAKKTVMISTHIMQEVEAVCSRVIIINKGQIVADGSVDKLKNGTFSNNQIVFVEFDKEVKTDELKAISEIINIESISNSSFIVEAGSDIDIRPELFRFAVKNNYILLVMKEQQRSLENVFHDLTR